MYDTPEFESYFWGSTVITEIATLNIGSRPASRTKTRKIEHLRAIPWVFSWAQCRAHAAGMVRLRFCLQGRGSRSTRTPALKFLQDMYREWGFFRTMLSNMEMVLAKSNIGIASRYAELVPDRKVRE